MVPMLPSSHTLIHAANLMAERGGHSNRGWAGGVSGVMDKNLGFLLNPARLAGGAAATALGMHLLGTSNPLFGAGARRHLWCLARRRWHDGYALPGEDVR
jgi:hypothetical protein